MKIEDEKKELYGGSILKSKKGSERVARGLVTTNWVKVLLDSRDEFALDAGVGSQGDGFLRLQVLENDVWLAQK